MSEQKDQKRDKLGRVHKGGMPKGAKTKKVIEREAYEDRWKRFYEEHADELNDTQWSVAKGVRHMMAKDRDGKWLKVTDPDIMLKCLNSGEDYYMIHAQNPDGNTIKDIYNRWFGMPKQKIEQDVTIGVKEDVLRVLQSGRDFAKKRSA